MAITNIVFLAACLQAAIAVPQHAHVGHNHYKRSNLPSGFPTGFPHPSGVPGGPVPYPVGNSSAGGATGTGTGTAGHGPVTIQSTINIVPMPQTMTESGSPASSGVGESGASGSSGSGSGEGESGASCGPATVTVTQANTVTVTVAAASAGAPSGAPIVSSPAGSIPVTGPSSAPYPVGNSSVLAGPTGTASVGTVFPSLQYQAPSSSTPAPGTTSAALVEVLSSSTPGPESTSAAPEEAAISAASSPASSVIPISSVEAHAYYNAPVQHHSYVTVVPSASSITPSVTPSVTPSPSIVESASSSTSEAPIASSSAPSKSNGGLKARGLLYGGQPAATAIANANAYLSAGNGAMGWGWNWDSSPSPQSGAATGSLDVQFVPMLLSPADVHTKFWDVNSAGHPYLMGFNEPDMTTGGGGSALTLGDCVTAWTTYMEPKRTGSTKLISPATTNTLTDANMGLQYMTSFLESCKGCHIDVLAFHYYGDASDLDYFKNTVAEYQKLQTLHSIPELWITEMAPNQAPTADQMSAFLEFLDDPSSGVARYAFNGLNTNTGQSLDMGVIKAAYQA